jgi:hypothetical protein
MSTPTSVRIVSAVRGPTPGIVISRSAASWKMQACLDLFAHRGDGRLEFIDAAPLDGKQEGLMGAEAASEGFFQRWFLLPQPLAAGPASFSGLCSPATSALEHCPARRPKDIARHRGQPDVCPLQHLLPPVPAVAE